MPAHRYFEEISSAAMLTTKRSAGVAPELNLRKCVTCMPLPSTNKVTHSGFEIQRRYHQPEVQNRGISGPTERTYVLQQFFLKVQNIFKTANRV